MSVGERGVEGVVNEGTIKASKSGRIAHIAPGEEAIKQRKFKEGQSCGCNR
jgi:hypothetical protein